jgi:serine/threonine-protein kinase
VTSVGDIIAGRYRIEEAIGEGGMGAVFRATHLELGRAVAVKVMRSDDPSEQSLERFLREAKSAACVDHRNVVDVLDYGREASGSHGAGRPYLVMECLAGESLEARLKRPPSPSLQDLVDWIAGALSGLAAIHDAGIVHRDLKPANLFLAQDADGIVPKVLDFGIARPTVEASALTHTMQTLGTPHYMSPEQVRSAKTVDARSDLYAVGVILYLAITGKLPFDGPSATAVIAAIVTDDPVPLSTLRPDVPLPMAAVVHRAMARDPSQRFESARVMRKALIDAQAGLGPGTTADRPSFTQAPTEMAGPPSKMTGDGPPPRPRTGRRGFFAMLGVLSMLLVAGLAGTLSMQMGSDAPMGSAPAASVADMASPSTPTPAAPAAATVAPALAPDVSRSRGPGARSAIEGTRAARMPFDRAALRARSLGAADRAGLRLLPDGDHAWLIAPHALANVLGMSGEDEATPSGARLVPTLMRANVRANVRREPSETGALLATLPEGTVVVVLRGEGDPEATSARWSRVVVAEGLVGHVATSLLSADAGCIPSDESVGDLHTWVVRERVFRGSEATDVLVLVEPGSRASAGSLRVEAVDSLCATTSLARLTFSAGALAELFLTRTSVDGDTLIAVGRWPDRHGVDPDGVMSWSVHPLGDIEHSVLGLDLRSGQNLPDGRRVGIGGPYREGDVYVPVRVRGRGGSIDYVWNGTALVPANAGE